MANIKTRCVLASVGLMAAVVGSAVMAQESTVQTPTINLETLDCRTFLKMNGEEEEFTLIFYHGLISGRRNELTFRGEELAEASDRIVDHCIDNPADKLLDVFEKQRKKS